MGTDRDTALYFQTCQYPKVMFVRWKKKIDLGPNVWREVTEKFNKLYKNNTENNEK